MYPNTLYRIAVYNITTDSITTQVTANASTKAVIQAKLASVPVPLDKIASKRTKLSLWYIIPTDTGNRLKAVLYEPIAYSSAPVPSPKKLYDLRKRLVTAMQDCGMMPRIDNNNKPK